MLVAAQNSCFSSGVEKWKLCFVLLLPLTVCFDSEVTLVKTIGSEPDITPICSNSTLSNQSIQLIVCKIRTESSRNECRLLYKYGEDFKHECDSRFTLIRKNQTVFLHLTSLTPEDSGYYTCECSDPEGTSILHLNITVIEEVVLEDKGRNNSTQIPLFLIVVTTVITVTTAIFGFIYISLHHRKQPEPLRSHPNTEPEDIEPYSTFIRREGGLYSTVRVNISHADPPHTSTTEPQSAYYK